MQTKLLKYFSLDYYSECFNCKHMQTKLLKYCSSHYYLVYLVCKHMQTQSVKYNSLFAYSIVIINNKIQHLQSKNPICLPKIKANESKFIQNEFGIGNAHHSQCKLKIHTSMNTYTPKFVHILCNRG